MSRGWITFLFLFCAGAYGDELIHLQGLSLNIEELLQEASRQSGVPIRLAVRNPPSQKNYYRCEADLQEILASAQGYLKRVANMETVLTREASGIILAERLAAVTAEPEAASKKPVEKPPSGKLGGAKKSTVAKVPPPSGAPKTLALRITEQEKLQPRASRWSRFKAWWHRDSAATGAPTTVPEPKAAVIPEVHLPRIEDIPAADAEISAAQGPAAGLRAATTGGNAKAGPSIQRVQGIAEAPSAPMRQPAFQAPPPAPPNPPGFQMAPAPRGRFRMGPAAAPPSGAQVSPKSQHP